MFFPLFALCWEPTHLGWRLKPRVVVALLAFASFLASSGCKELDAHIAANDGFKAYKARDYDKAIVKYDEALQGKPGNALLQKNLAYAHMAAARNGTGDRASFDAHMVRAIAILTPLVKADRTDKESVEQLFSAWTEAGRLDQAAAFFIDWANSEDSDEAWRLVAQVEAQRANYPAALAAFKKRIQKNPTDPSLKLAIGTLSWEWLRQGGPIDNEEALRVATAAYDATLEADKAGQSNAMTYAGLILRERAKRQATEVDAQADLKRAEEIAALLRTREPDTSATAQKVPH